MCKVNAGTITAAQTRGNVKKSLLIKVLPLQEKQQRASYSQHFHTWGVIKKTLGSAVQTELKFFSDNAKAPLLKDQSLVTVLPQILEALKARAGDDCPHHSSGTVCFCRH